MSNVSANNWRNRILNFKVFTDRLDFIQKSKDAYEYLDKKSGSMFTTNSRPNRKYSDYIDKSYLTDMEFETDYEDQRKLNKYLESFDEIMSKIDMGGAFKKSRLRITADERGIFSFGLASKGLFAPVEYYSSELAIDSPEEFPEKESGIVPANFVENIEMFGVKQFWYESDTTKKRYLLTKQDEGTRGVDLGLRLNKILRTSNKKSYVMFEKKGGKAKMVELYLPLHYSVDLENMIPLLLIARFLRMYGVMVRISTIRMFDEGGRDGFFGWGYPIKDYGEELDFNSMALNGVDKRWWYSIQVGVRAITDKASYDRTKSFGNTISGQGGSAGSLSSYIEVFSRYRNWYMEQIETGELEPLRVDKKLMLIGGAFGDFSNLEGITKEFFRILDTVDFQFNKTEDSCKRIYTREVDEKLQDFYSKNPKNLSQDALDRMMPVLKAQYISEYKIYVQSLLVATYTYPVGGMYEEPIESAEKLDIEFDEKIEKMSQFLKNI
jgi:hypothetical protein